MVSLIFRIKMLEGKEDQAVAVLSKMCEQVEAAEPQSLAYVFHRSLKEPSQAVLFEAYEDDAALQAHVQTPHKGELRKAMGEFFDASQIQAERIERVAGFARGAAAPAGAVSVLFFSNVKKDQADDGFAALSKMAQAVEANEPQTLTYIVSRTLSDPTRAAVFEVYASDADFQAHLQTPHMAEMQKSGAALLEPGTGSLERLERVGGFIRATS